LTKTKIGKVLNNSEKKSRKGRRLKVEFKQENMVALEAKQK
jgi:hypothetical protein